MSTFIAILSGLILMTLAIVDQGGLAIFINLPSVIITIGGTMVAVFISYPLPQVVKVVKVVANVFRSDFQNPAHLIGLVVELSYKARQESLLSLEAETKKAGNRFLKLGIELVVDGHPPEMVREVMQTEIDFLQFRHVAGEQILRKAASYAPAFGLIGTLIGLIAMLRGLANVSAENIGPSMAVALITTFYGAMMANLLLLPLAEKLRARTNEEVLHLKIITEGILLIQSGVNPRIVEKKLNSFLPPQLRFLHHKKYMKAKEQ